MGNERTIIVFDLDDTLYHEQDFVISAYREMAVRLERASGKQRLFEIIMDSYQRGEDVFSTVEAYCGSLVSKEELLQMYRAHSPAIALDADVCHTLERLREAGCALGLMTDGRSVTQRKKIEALGLSAFMEERDMLISEEFGSEKPDMRNYEYFMKRYPGSRYCYVGDNTAKDFVSPNMLGWKTICLIDDGRNIHKQDFTLEKRFLPSCRIKKISDLIGMKVN